MATRDRRDHLLRCLHHLAALRQPCRAVVVADDASDDGSADAVRRRFPGTHVVAAESPLGGAARVRNLGIRYALRHLEFEHFLFLDDDAFVQPDTLGELLAALEAGPEVGIVAPKAYHSLAERRLQVAGELHVNLYTGVVKDVGSFEVDEGQHDAPRTIRACSSCAMLVRRRVVEELHGFDEAFVGAAWEDVDFCLRAGSRGFLIAYQPRARVEHLGGKRGRGRRYDREWAKARNWLLVMRRHATPLQWACFLALLPLRATVIAWRQHADAEGWAIRAQVRGLLEAVGLRRAGGR